jgi:hypothetical protein
MTNVLRQIDFKANRLRDARIHGNLVYFKYFKSFHHQIHFIIIF